MASVVIIIPFQIVSFESFWTSQSSYIYELFSCG